MNNRILTLVVAIISLIFIQASCKNGRLGGSADCPKKKVEELEDVIRYEVQKDFSFFYGKVKVSVKDSKQNNSFNATVKMKPDSAFAGTVKVAGILGAAYLIDQDTFAYKHKINKCYKRESFNSLTDLFGTEMSYTFAQQLILGQAVGEEKVEEFFPLKDEKYYILASHDRKAFDRLEIKNLSDEEMEDIFIRYTLDCDKLELVNIKIDVPKDNVSINIDFTERQDVKGFSLPEETNVKIVTPKDSVFIDLKYTSIALNTPKKINLSIPDSYEECK